MIHFTFLILTVIFTTSGHPSDVPPSAAILTPFSNAGDLTSQKIQQLIGKKAVPLVPPFPDSGRKHAVLEQESFVSKADSAYSNLQQFVADFYHPKPVVDTIRPEDKYGNDGSKNREVAVAVIGAVEGASNLLNAAVDVPFEVTRQVSKKVQKTLSPVGALFVGR